MKRRFQTLIAIEVLVVCIAGVISYLEVFEGLPFGYTLAYLNALSVGLLIAFVLLAYGIHFLSGLIERFRLSRSRWPARIVFLLIMVSILWFFGFHGGYCGEVSTRKIRLGVYEWDGFGDTDSTDWAGIFFSMDLVGVSWGGVGALKKIGGPAEYFGLKDATCSFSGKPPTKVR